MIPPIFSPAADRYENGMKYRRCGRSGILLPEISLGLWHNFGDVDTLANSLKKAHYAFDHGITHFDLANNYGPSYGSAEETFGTIMEKSFRPYRDELFISTKAGHDMWPGPYGDWGSRKYLFASLEQSLRRMKLDYVDIFYSHRFDPQTPLEETLQALVDIVRQGKALYVGISKYPKEAADFAYNYLAERDVPCLLYQGRYNIFNREPEQEGILADAKEKGCGFIAFSPLAQGLLTDRYLNGIPEDSRVARGGFLKKEALTDETIAKIRRLNEVALRRGQTLAEMSLAWVLKDDLVTSVIIGASSVEQIERNLKALDNTSFTPEELSEINEITLA
ncbi:MAG: L-glyceraldehyde 3-phosphate reductase [Bacteroidales bacterium]|nr:L-glyceraldehyde 3-phosphate reductase [Bacteroidales bacterium]